MNSKTKTGLEYSAYGEHAILIEWPAEISAENSNMILAFDNMVNAQMKSSIIETIIAYNSLTVFFKPWVNLSDMVFVILGLDEQVHRVDRNAGKIWKIPVCYDLEFGIDLTEMSQVLGLSVQQIISLHTKSEYQVYFIGFLPGFLYLGGLDEQIHFPRKAEPRLRVEKGAVAIGGQQTGIYPKTCPAGWQVIGNSPIDLFEPKKEKPCFISSGDAVQFYEISKEEHRVINSEVKRGIFEIKNE